MHRVISGIKIEDDLARGAVMRLQKQIDHQRLDGDRIVTDLVIARRFQTAQLQRFNVDLPATSAQSSRPRDSSLAASTAIIGSWRSSSSSLRSSEPSEIPNTR